MDRTKFKSILSIFGLLLIILPFVLFTLWFYSNFALRVSHLSDGEYNTIGFAIFLSLSVMTIGILIITFKSEIYEYINKKKS